MDRLVESYARELDAIIDPNYYAEHEREEIERDEVRRYLRELGYGDVPDDVLREFVTELEDVLRLEGYPSPSPDPYRRDEEEEESEPEPAPVQARSRERERDRNGQHEHEQDLARRDARKYPRQDSSAAGPAAARDHADIITHRGSAWSDERVHVQEDKARPRRTGGREQEDRGRYRYGGTAEREHEHEEEREREHAGRNAPTRAGGVGGRDARGGAGPASRGAPAAATVAGIGRDTARRLSDRSPPLRTGTGAGAERFKDSYGTAGERARGGNGSGNAVKPHSQGQSHAQGYPNSNRNPNRRASTSTDYASVPTAAEAEAYLGHAAEPTHRDRGYGNPRETAPRRRASTRSDAGYAFRETPFSAGSALDPGWDPYGSSGSRTYGMSRGASVDQISVTNTRLGPPPLPRARPMYRKKSDPVRTYHTMQAIWKNDPFLKRLK
ncbi:hypothetical protein M427DRAFT_66858 [Gonapodya prolifera JEL478]|uniref:Uncharacterized protein n=1 Tax=Gonapodya prolifera (strain JEL478) TaxID=1344416 RepID=A0A139AT67_GONPJ|nr:hypothetical protein M427DRAFT_66858 [Gonapodya prolifera JEL478]|eukprot:KXS19695.1 hypothetical protein M427DRAFT_66858 [Gonapodya prolifera JEL478]